MLFVCVVALLELSFKLLYGRLLADHSYGALRILVDILNTSLFALFLHSYQLGSAEARACDRWPPKAGGASPGKAAAPESSSLQQRIADLENDLVKVCPSPTLQLVSWAFLYS